MQSLIPRDLTDVQKLALKECTGASLSVIESWRQGRPVARRYIPAVARWLAGNDPLGESSLGEILEALCLYQEEVKP